VNNRLMSDPELDKRLIGNLRRARLAFEEVDLQLEELVAKCDELIRQQFGSKSCNVLNRNKKTS
jgi:hypothetical protein